LISKIRKAVKKVERALKKINKVVKKKTDKKWGKAIKYTEKDLVWIEGLNINFDQLAKKLVFKRANITITISCLL